MTTKSETMWMAKSRAGFFLPWAWSESRSGVVTVMNHSPSWARSDYTVVRVRITEIKRRTPPRRSLPMAAESICDGCGKRAPMQQGTLGTWHKPGNWYERSDKDGIQTACSRECIDKIAKKSGKTTCVLPV